MEIRTGQIRDIQQINQLWLETAKHHKQFDNKMYSRVSKKDILNHTKTTKEIINNKNKQLLVAIEDKNVVGYIIGSVLNENKQKIGQIADLIVTKTYRKKGIATELIKNILDFFKTKKCTKLRVNVFENNTAAIQAYTKCGFKKHIAIMEKRLS